MKTLIVSLLSLFAINAYANDPCTEEIQEVANVAHRGLGLDRIEATDIFLKPGDEQFYMQGEIWHPKRYDFDVQIYEVEVSGYGMRFIYAYNVNPDTCRHYGFTEVFFE